MVQFDSEGITTAGKDFSHSLEMTKSNGPVISNEVRDLSELKRPGLEFKVQSLTSGLILYLELGTKDLEGRIR